MWDNAKKIILIHNIYILSCKQHRIFYYVFFYNNEIIETSLIFIYLSSIHDKGAELILSDGGGDILIGDVNNNEQTTVSGFSAPGSGRQHPYFPDKCK